MSSQPSSQARQCDGVPRSIKVRIYDSRYLSDKTRQPLDSLRIRITSTASYGDLGKLVVDRIIQNPPTQGVPGTEVTSILDEQGFAFDKSDLIDATERNEFVCFVLAVSNNVSTTGDSHKGKPSDNGSPKQHLKAKKPLIAPVAASQSGLKSARRVSSSSSCVEIPSTPSKPSRPSAGNRSSSNKTTGPAIKKTVRGVPVQVGGKRSVSGSSQKPKPITEPSQTVRTVSSSIAAQETPSAIKSSKGSSHYPSKKDPYQVPSEDDDVKEAPKPVRKRTNTVSKPATGSSKGDKTPSPKPSVPETPRRIKSEHTPRSRNQTLKQIANGVKIHELDSDDAQPATGPATPTPRRKITQAKTTPDTRQQVRQQIASGVPVVALGDSSSSSSDDDDDVVIKSEPIVKPEPTEISGKALGKRSSHTINEHIAFANPVPTKLPQPIMAKNSRGVFPVYRKGDPRAVKHEKPSDRTESINVEPSRASSQPSLSSKKSRKTEPFVPQKSITDRFQRGKSQQPSDPEAEKFDKIPRRSRSKSVGPSSAKSSAANTPRNLREEPTILEKLNRKINGRLLQLEFGSSNLEEVNPSTSSTGKSQRVITPQEAINECKKTTKYRRGNKLSQTSLPDSFLHETDESDSGYLPQPDTLRPKSLEPPPRTKTPVSSQASVWKTPQSRRSQASKRSNPVTPINTLRRQSPKEEPTMPETRIHRGYPKNMRDAFSDASKSPTPDYVPVAIDSGRYQSKTFQKEECQNPEPVERRPWWPPEEWIKRYKTKFAADGPDCVWIADGPYEGLILAGPRKGDYISDCEAPSGQQIAHMEKTAERQDASDSDSPEEFGNSTDDKKAEVGATHRSAMTPRLEEGHDKMNLTGYQPECCEVDPSDYETLLKHEEPQLPLNTLPKPQDDRSPQSEESDRTSNLITKQLENTPLVEPDAPPSNQELGEIMSSSPSKRWNRIDGLERPSVAGNLDWWTGVTDENLNPPDSTDPLQYTDGYDHLQSPLSDDALIAPPQIASKGFREAHSTSGRDIRSFEEIAAMNATQSSQPYDSDLEFVLDKSPGWLKDLTEVSSSPERPSSSKRTRTEPLSAMKPTQIQKSADVSSSHALESVANLKKRSSHPMGNDHRRKKVKLSEPRFSCEGQGKTSGKGKITGSSYQKRLRTPKHEVRYTIADDESDKVITPRSGTPTPPVKLPSHISAQQTAFPDHHMASKEPAMRDLNSPSSGPQLFQRTKKVSDSKSLNHQSEDSAGRAKPVEKQVERKKSKHKRRRDDTKREEDCDEMNPLSSIENRNFGCLQNVGKSLEIIARGDRSPSLSMCDTPPLVNKKQKRRSKSVPPQRASHDFKPAAIRKDETECKPKGNSQRSHQSDNKKFGSSHKPHRKNRNRKKDKKGRTKSTSHQSPLMTGLPPAQKHVDFTAMVTPPATSRHTSPESKVDN